MGNRLALNLVPQMAILLELKKVEPMAETLGPRLERLSAQP
jgi:hypothetical protein